MSGTPFEHGLTMTIDTYAKIPDAKKGAYSEANKDKFFKDWAKELATGDKARGIYVLVCRSPGYVEIIADKETRDRGFSHDNEVKLKDILLKAFREAKDKSEAEQHQIRDNALKAAVDYVISDLKDSTVATPVNATSQNTKGSTGMSIGGWICIGLVVLLGIWLVV